MPIRRYGRRQLSTSREDKLLFGGSGITKGHLIDYYERAWPRMRAHLLDRPLVMERYPDGIEREGFYQKQVGKHFPDWLERVRVPRRDDGEQTLLLCNQEAALAFVANQACVTPHLWLSRADALEQPDQLLLDLDPPGPDFAPVRQAALQCKTLLDELSLFSVLKTTGSRGVHVIVPIRRGPRFEPVRDLARQVAGTLARRSPRTLTTEQRKAKRDGRLYLDVGRNAYAQTAVAPYGVRALPGAPVATPLDWSELADAGLHARTFALRSIAQRLAAADPWSGWRRHACALDAARARLAQIAADDERPRRARSRGR